MPKALSIKQPYAEEILRGIKKIEYRTVATHFRGRFHIYASLKPGDEDRFRKLGCESGDLPTGVLVGTVELVDCVGSKSAYEWHLAKPKRLARLNRPRGKPQPVWFNA